MDPDKDTLKAAHLLHKGLGVRRDDLRQLVSDTRLGHLWLIPRGDTGTLLLAQVIYRVEQEFPLVSSEARLAAAVTYNTPADLHMHDLSLEARHQLLRQRQPHGRYSQRTLSRVTTMVSEAVERSLYSPRPVIPDRDLLEIVRREEEFADEVNGRIGPAAFDRRVQQIYAVPVTEAATDFLRLSVFVPSSDTHELIIARTVDYGDWLCVFSTETNLLAFQRWSGGWVRMLGAEVVRAVASRWSTVGILVNPPAKRSSDVLTALRIPPSLVAELAGEEQRR